MPGNRLLFISAVVIGGLVVGGLGASGIPSASPVRAGGVARAASPIGAHPQVEVANAAIANDSYAQAMIDDYNPPVEFIFHMDGATIERHETVTFNPQSSYVALSSTWLSWKALASGTMSLQSDTLTTVSAAAYAVYTGSTMATATRIAWATSEGVSTAHMSLGSFSVTKGVTYHIQIAAIGPEGTAAPTGDISVEMDGHYDRPPSDDKADAIGVSGSSWTSTANSNGATLEPAWEPTAIEGTSGYHRTNSIWWKWTASADGTLSSTMKLDYLTTESYLAIFERNDSHELSEVAFADNHLDINGRSTITNLFVRAGWTYYFAAGNLADDDGGPLTVTTKVNYTGPTVASVSPPSGSIKGGTRILITGTRLSTATQVYIGQETGTNIHVLSSTKLLVTVPTGLAKGKTNVVVLVASGESSALGAHTFFTYK